MSLVETAMDQAPRKQEFLARAKQAEQEATKAKTADMRDGWLKVALGYRNLAQMA